MTTSCRDMNSSSNRTSKGTPTCSPFPAQRTRKRHVVIIPRRFAPIAPPSDLRKITSAVALPKRSGETEYCTRRRIVTLLSPIPIPIRVKAPKTFPRAGAPPKGVNQQNPTRSTSMATTIIGRNPTRSARRLAKMEKMTQLKKIGSKDLPANEGPSLKAPWTKRGKKPRAPRRTMPVSQLTKRERPIVRSRKNSAGMGESGFFRPALNKITEDTTKKKTRSIPLKRSEKCPSKSRRRLRLAPTRAKISIMPTPPLDRRRVSVGSAPPTNSAATTPKGTPR